MLAAIRTGLGKVPGSKLIALGTRAEDAGHWFSRMLESAPYSQLHTARPDDPPFWLKTLRKANPSIDHLPSLKGSDIYRDGRCEDRSRTRLAGYKALRLNLGV